MHRQNTYQFSKARCAKRICRSDIYRVTGRASHRYQW